MKQESKNEEYVELVDDDGMPTGKALKSEVHTDKTPLHRAFSVYVFNSHGQLLIQQRSSLKKTWPLIWTNTCCGHPAPGENTAHAVQRKLKQELGLSVKHLSIILPDFRYRVGLNNIFENELCPVFVAFSDQETEINSDEAAAARWIDWPQFQEEVLVEGSAYSPWCVMQVKQLKKSAKFKELMQEHSNI